MTVLRAEERVGTYVITVGAMAAVTCGGIVAFVLVADLGVAGWLAGVALGNAAGLITGALVVPWARPESFDRDA